MKNSSRIKTRFRIRFGLQTCLIGVTLCASGLGWFGYVFNRAQKQRKSVEWVRENGGGVSYDLPFPNRGRPENMPSILVDLLGIDFFVSVKNVSLGRKTNGLTKLSGFVKIQNLVVVDENIDDLSPIGDLTTLRFLTLRATDESDFSSFENLLDLESIGVVMIDVDPDESELRTLKKVLPNLTIHYCRLRSEWKKL